MASSDALVEHCRELLSPLGPVQARRMFGGWGLYADGFFVALVWQRLYLKTDDTTRERFAAAGSQPFVYEARGKRMTIGYWSAPDEAMDSPALMLPWARLALQAAVAARGRPRAARRKRPAAQAGGASSSSTRASG